ncbi:MAG: putative metal-binding motif-containing protein [Sandaracinus sp.]|nr:putative metal-binding motif-containing protein [Sandaracinus sp.]MCB9623163.1 putative metal-binding motif-containing protein [Sandaracinus sp.]
MECDESTRTCGEACRDVDGDGAADVRCGGTDCDDSDENIGPGSVEICDEGGVDEDCDPSTVAGPEGDADEDGFVAERCCNGEHCGTDCNDSDRAINPGSVDPCGGGDQDCDGSVDENPDETFYRDRDGDGFGIEGDTIVACGAPGGYAVLPGDCNDEQRNINPSGSEVCDAMVDDEDCDDSIDENCPCTPEGLSEACDTTFAGRGVCRAGSRVCTFDGWTGCLDSVLPGIEQCNADSRDEDCDDMVDEGCECINGTTRRCGMDTGRCQSVLQTCVDGAWPRSCAEQAGVIEPTTEICNGGVDDDCDSITDEGCACTNGMTRPCGSDEGYCSAGTQTCTTGAWGACTGAVGPRTETCNGIDDDCDGVPDNSDLDIAGVNAVCGTNQGTCRQGTQQCNGSSLVCSGTYVGPTAETCNHLNDDCDSRVDESVHRACEWNSATRSIANARSSFHGCLPSACSTIGRPATSIQRMVQATDTTRHALYLNSGDLVDWGGSTFRVTSTHLLTRTSITGPIPFLTTTITPQRTVGSASSGRTRSLPTVSAGRRGYAAMFDYVSRNAYLYRLTPAGPVEIGVSSRSISSNCVMNATNTTMRVSVGLESSGSQMRAIVSVWGPPGCDDSLTVTATESDWIANLYGESSSYPRYEIGTIVDPQIANGTVDLEALHVQRYAPVSFGSFIGDRGHCVGCPSSWL